jgi:hypothetical protein
MDRRFRDYSRGQRNPRFARPVTVSHTVEPGLLCSRFARAMCSVLRGDQACHDGPCLLQPSPAARPGTPGEGATGELAAQLHHL